VIRTSHSAGICLKFGETPVGEDEDQWLTDAQARKLGERLGLETPVVQAVNDECYLSIIYVE